MVADGCLCCPALFYSLVGPAGLLTGALSLVIRPSCLLLLLAATELGAEGALKLGEDGLVGDGGAALVRVDNSWLLVDGGGKLLLSHVLGLARLLDLLGHRQLNLSNPLRLVCIVELAEVHTAAACCVGGSLADTRAGSTRGLLLAPHCHGLLALCEDDRLPVGRVDGFRHGRCEELGVPM